MDLIIVESPTKAKTFNKYIDSKKYLVVSSMGHIRDLPKKKLGIDLENNFELEYEIIPGKKKIIDPLVKDAKRAQRIILATDADREGEAIAFHIKQVLLKKVKKNIEFDRIVFHEITKEALKEALAKSKSINEKLFDAQQARRVLDRIVGYKISPYLWKRFSKSWLSAGRVQSVALRFIVEREKERDVFKSNHYYVIKADFLSKKIKLEAKLIELKGKLFYTSEKIDLFDGSYEFQKTLIKSDSQVKEEMNRLGKEKYSIDKVKESDSFRKPPAPFTTSTLQQKAVNLFGFSAKRTMRIAQSLYEYGLITYHRTDSFNISDKFIRDCRNWIVKQYGEEYLSATKRIFKQKSKLAQEAHEAIRPTDVTKDSKSKSILKLKLDEQKIYTLIYNRALATQMKEAYFKRQKIIIKSGMNDKFSTDYQEIKFYGYLILEKEHLSKDKGLVKNLKEKTSMIMKNLNVENKETLPPPRYSEASLIKTLEKQGIGRPSTYAPIISLIQERFYVTKEGRELSPSELGRTVSDLLVKSFKQIFDINFTAQMESDLDRVAVGKMKWKNIVREFYKPFKFNLDQAYKDTEKIKVEEKTDKKCPKCKSDLLIKLSRFGKFYACSAFPNCRYTENYLEKIGMSCPKCKKGNVVIRFSKKKRKFYACDTYPQCDYTSLWPPKEK
jgi:DNA topoisomerase-1